MGVRIATALAGATLLLAACGGGGGGGSVGMSGSGPGSSVPSDPALDTIVLGDVLVSAQGQLFRLEESCDGTVCTVLFQGETARIDLRDVHPDGPDVTITGQQTRNGVQTGRATASGGQLIYDTFGVWGPTMSARRSSDRRPFKAWTSDSPFPCLSEWAAVRTR